MAGSLLAITAAAMTLAPAAQAEKLSAADAYSNFTSRAPQMTEDGKGAGPARNVPKSARKDIETPISSPDKIYKSERK
ncbi:unnamed protein product [Pedinophyceae sp. YPF-701]|nr:unnamed protein product [Pedinophyceae sp. YPF-701]